MRGAEAADARRRAAHPSIACTVFVAAAAALYVSFAVYSLYNVAATWPER